MSRLGAVKKRAQQRGIKGQRIEYTIVDDPHSGEPVDRAAVERWHATVERALFATPVPASQGQRARMLVLGLPLVACVAWWALALWEVLR